jgi:hypothetical protein
MAVGEAIEKQEQLRPAPAADPLGEARLVPGVQFARAPQQRLALRRQV